MRTVALSLSDIVCTAQQVQGNKQGRAMCSVDQLDQIKLLIVAAVVSKHALSSLPRVLSGCCHCNPALVRQNQYRHTKKKKKKRWADNLPRCCCRVLRAACKIFRCEA